MPLQTIAMDLHPDGQRIAIAVSAGASEAVRHKVVFILGLLRLPAPDRSGPDHALTKAHVLSCAGSGGARGA